MGGRLAVESDPESGTIFKFIFICALRIAFIAEEPVMPVPDISLS
jgi:hypothetical protein